MAGSTPGACTSAHAGGHAGAGPSSSKPTGLLCWPREPPLTREGQGSAEPCARRKGGDPAASSGRGCALPAEQEVGVSEGRRGCGGDHRDWSGLRWRGDLHVPSVPSSHGQPHLPRQGGQGCSNARRVHGPVCLAEDEGRGGSTPTRGCGVEGRKPPGARHRLERGACALRPEPRLAAGRIRSLRHGLCGFGGRQLGATRAHV
mmetsp:Transcript_29837/g.88628  ORF Transcript_29837/g.88628 Transcript_29837/m.88628 type:complete len:203 (+) Transcript_29837:168-776(+)